MRSHLIDQLIAHSDQFRRGTTASQGTDTLPSQLAPCGPCKATAPSQATTAILSLCRCPQPLAAQGYSPDAVARDIAEATGAPAIVADMNNISGTIKGYSRDDLRQWDFVDILRDNPMGQMQNMTPIGIVRPLDSPDH